MNTGGGIPICRFGNGCINIRYAHPEARIPDNILCYGLIDALKELINLKLTELLSRCGSPTNPSLQAYPLGHALPVRK